MIQIDASERIAIGLAVAAKAIIIGLIISLADVGFVEQIVLTLISATVAGGYAFVIAWYTTRHADKLHVRLDDIEQRQVDAANTYAVDHELPSQPNQSPRV